MPIRFEDPFDEHRVQHFFDHEYVDRGIVKWQGYFLSDHTSALKHLHSKVLEISKTQLEQQAIITIQRRLIVANESNTPVLVQFNQIDGATGQLLIVIGTVTGVRADECQIEDQSYELTDIRGVIGVIDK